MLRKLYSSVLPQLLLQLYLFRSILLYIVYIVTESNERTNIVLYMPPPPPATATRHMF